MKAASIDGRIWSEMDQFEAQVIAAACDRVACDWSKGDDFARKMAHICIQIKDEYVGAVLAHKSMQSVPNRTDNQTPKQ